MQATVQSPTTQPNGVARLRGRPPKPATPPDLPPIVTVYRGLEGGVFHARCNTRLDFLGILNGGLEHEHYCMRCRETVTLVEQILARIPIRRPV